MFQATVCRGSTFSRRFLAIESITLSGAGSPENSTMLYDPNTLQKQYAIGNGQQTDIQRCGQSDCQARSLDLSLPSYARL